jgi:hypothetical protein
MPLFRISELANTLHCAVAALLPIKAVRQYCEGVSVKFRISLLFALLCLSLTVFSARSGLAQALQPIQPQEPAWLTQMYAEGWQKVQEGVLQRTGEGGQHETFTYGEDGLRWNARMLEARLSFLQNEYNAHPSKDIADLITTLKGELIKADEQLKTGQVETPSDEMMGDCTISYGANAVADPLTGSQAPGVMASASAYFHATCGQVGNALAYTQGRGTLGSVFTYKTQQDPVESTYDSSWVDRAASVSVPGSVDCYSQAVGRVTSTQLNISYETSDENFSCPPYQNPLSVSISGPYDVWTDSYTPCQYVTWTASAAGGAPGYGYDWYIGGTYQGSGSSLTKRYCRLNGSVTVQVTAYDTVPQYANGSFTTYFYYEYSCGSGCACSIYDEPTNGTSSDPNAVPICN